jgi:hypothetical protein
MPRTTAGFEGLLGRPFIEDLPLWVASRSRKVQKIGAVVAVERFTP